MIAADLDKRRLIRRRFAKETGDFTAQGKR
jgi:hypothetical protein